MFDSGEKAGAAAPPIDVKSPHAKIVSRRWRVIFIRRARQGRPVAGRKEMIDRKHKLPVGWQAGLLGIRRGSVYYLPHPTPDADFALVRPMDELHLYYPFAGSRNAAGAVDARWLRSGAVARRDADQDNGHRGDLSPAEHLETCAGK